MTRQGRVWPGTGGFRAEQGGADSLAVLAGAVITASPPALQVSPHCPLTVPAGPRALADLQLLNLPLCSLQPPAELLDDSLEAADRLLELRELTAGGAGRV